MFEELENYLHDTIRLNDRMVLSGDFNLPNIHWPTFTLTKCNLVGEAMLKITFTYDIQFVQDYQNSGVFQIHVGLTFCQRIN